ncbi:MAG: hypothetical protein AB8I08_36745 [Sandaracinaceae bacterium]
MKRATLTALAAMVTLGLGMPSTSEACMHIVEFSKDDAVAAVAQADRMLSEGRATRAYQAARRARRRLERHMRANGRDAATEAVVARARRITALAAVRLDGYTPVSARTARRHVLRGRAERSLRWARERLRTRAEARPEDLRAQMHYAEALARLPDGRAEAAQILGRLAERDLMPDAHGYAALLRVSAPGSQSWNRALTRCQQMAPDDASRICPSASAPHS